jgi:hypothetical protein
LHQLSIMAAHDDDNYELDARGARVLIGLTADETAEFARLDESISNRLPSMSKHEWSSAEEQRWLVLYEKHVSAKRPFLAASKTKH